jgi:hypothetical protein
MKLLAIILPMLVAAPALADDKAAADAAFTRAKELIKQGNYAEACPLFEASHRADPQIGALLNIADCHEHVGRTASAWAEFRESEELATKRHDPRAAYAKQRADALADHLAKLRVTAPAIAGLVVRRDGVDVTLFVGQELPVDPGDHVVSASAPGRVDWKTTVTIAAEPATTPLEVPALELAPDPPASPLDLRGTITPPVYDFDTRAQHKRRIAALAVGAPGVVALAVGLGFGVHARTEYTDAHAGATPRCDATNICTQAGTAMLHSARTQALVADLGVGVGLAAIATAAVVWYTAPGPLRKERKLARVVPTANGFAVAGAF